MPGMMYDAALPALMALGFQTVHLECFERKGFRKISSTRAVDLHTLACDVPRLLEGSLEDSAADGSGKSHTACSRGPAVTRVVAALALAPVILALLPSAGHS
eukprot:gnl/TRDRNA2_/TRDRNA2_99008_c2_seq1.p3 gnl/TRDRNA2_/TRDRNA2_99008_c2~~gnl/TRDRNA2_/TRDRNA2_99008_c2_seq1.p3  ORF type:complete len:102 (-),score=5.91 gnl/TRDRNA2_/TRDRNA2_99008_c2_seq1:440-745(-)